MEIRQLKYFIQAAEYLNFTRAAKECGIVQTAMTQQIANLENEIGIRLFDRKEELLPALSAFVKPGDAVLFKGSNSMGLSAVLTDLLRTMDEEAGD